MPAQGRNIESLRPRLFGLAYRMLGSRQDAEDAVQDAFLRWYRSDTADIRSQEAWLVTTLSRLCIDRLRVLASERRAYVGPWLPEPVAEVSTLPDRNAELFSEMSMALMVVLERLSPEERVALLMHDVFDCTYPVIADVLQKSEVACRQVVHRARLKVRRDKPRFDVSPETHRRLIDRYMQAIQQHDPDAIAALLAPDAVFTSDGGGKVWAALRPIVGARRIARLEVGVVQKLDGQLAMRPALVNGKVGLVSHLDGRLHAVTSFETDGSNILTVMRVLNPQKLVMFSALAI